MDFKHYVKPYLYEGLIPEFIKMGFDDEDFKWTTNPTIRELNEMGQYFLEKKIQFHLIKHGDDKRYKDPDSFTFREVGVLLLMLFDFAMVQTMPNLTNDPAYSMLAIYQSSGVNEGLYQTSKNTIKQLVQALGFDFSDLDVKNTLGFIERMAEANKKVLTHDPHLIPVKNGVYNKDSGMLEPFSADYVFFSKIQVDYVEDKKNPIINTYDYSWDVESWLNDLFETDQEVQLIWEVIADTLQPNKARNKSIWFYANKGNNGKGTVGQLIKNLHGSGNYSSLNVQKFSDRFAKAQLLKVNCNIADENNVNDYIDQVDDYKASITGDDITVDQKYEKPVTFRFQGTNIQMMNGLPKVKDKTNSFTRRLIIVPFIKCFTNNGERREIKREYVKDKDVLEYVLQKCLKMDFEEFTVPESSKELLLKFEEDNNPVQQFWNEFGEKFQWVLLPSDFLYELYSNWYKEVNPNGKRMGKHTFLDELAEVTVGILDDKRDQTVWVGNKMDEDEPLITEYNIKKYQTSGSSLRAIRDFNRKSSYRGFEFL